MGSQWRGEGKGRSGRSGEKHRSTIEHGGPLERIGGALKRLDCLKGSHIRLMQAFLRAGKGRPLGKGFAALATGPFEFSAKNRQISRGWLVTRTIIASRQLSG